MSLPPAFLETLRSRLPLSDIVGQRVKLVRAGRELKGCCPFHNEKTPSFTVNDSKGFFHCFGCGAHGDVISFVMRHDRLAFPEAVELLAGQAGLEVPRFSPDDLDRARQQKTLHQLCETACVWFEQQLRASRGREGLAYLTGRGLGEETLRRFRLGYAPADAQALLTHLKAQGFEPDQMVEVGLARRREEDGSLYAFFRDRVLFPVTDRRGRVVAFGGRILKGDGPKYINSPDHPLFHKGQLLYSLARAREAAPRGAPVVVVEGYMDVIALVEAGFEAAVAPLGTALTEEQIAELWKLGGTAGDPILCFDGDTAGQRAAARAVERVLPGLGPGKSLRFAFLPGGQDPDDLIRREGARAMRAVLEAAIPLVDMIWRLETAARPADTPESRAAVKAALETHVVRIADKTVQGYYRTEFLARLEAAYGWGRISREKSSGNSRFQPPRTASPLAAPPVPPDPRVVWQRQIVLALLRHPHLFDALGEQLVRLDLQGPLDKLWQAVVTTLENQPGLDPAGLSACLCELGFADLLANLLSDRASAQSWVRDGASPDVVAERLEEILFMHHARTARASMREAGQQYEQDVSDAARARMAALRDVLQAEDETAG